MEIAFFHFFFSNCLQLLFSLKIFENRCFFDVFREDKDSSKLIDLNTLISTLNLGKNLSLEKEYLLYILFNYITVKRLQLKLIPLIHYSPVLLFYTP